MSDQEIKEFLQKITNNIFDAENYHGLTKDEQMGAYILYNLANLSKKDITSVAISYGHDTTCNSDEDDKCINTASKVISFPTKMNHYFNSQDVEIYPIVH